MAKENLYPGTRFVKNEVTYEIRKVFLKNKIEVINLIDGISESIPISEIENALFEGKLKFEVKGRNIKINNGKEIQTNYVWEDFNLIHENQRKIAWERYKIIQKIKLIPKEERTNKSINEAVKNYYNDQENLMELHYKKPPSLRNIYRWIKYFDDSGGDIRSLVTQYENSGGKGKSKLDDKVESILEYVIQNYYLSTQRLTVTSIYHNVINHISDENKFREYKDKIKIPSFSTVYRKTKDIELYKLMEGRYGKRLAQQEFKQVNKGVNVTRPLQRVEIDHTVCDLFIVDEEDRLPIGRPTITYALDKYTGYPTGFYVSFEPPSYHSVMMCLRHSIMPKHYVKKYYPDIRNEWPVCGIPEELVVDNGKEFIGKDLEHACAQLGISILNTPVKQPWFKGSIERHFKTLNTELLHSIPGTTFSNIIDRADYDPAKNAIISLNAFIELLHIWIIDFYSQDFNKGIKGIPINLWKEAMDTTIPSYPPNKEILNILLSRVENRTIQRYGIELFGIKYNSSELFELRSTRTENDKGKETFLIKYDPGDLSKIYLYDHLITNSYIEVQSTDIEYTSGLSLWKHNVIKNLLKKEQRKVDIVSLADAKRRISQVIEREWSKVRKSRTRKTLARYKGNELPMWEDNQTINSEVISGVTIPKVIGDNDTINTHQGISDLNALEDTRTITDKVDVNTVNVIDKKEDKLQQSNNSRNNNRNKSNKSKSKKDKEKLPLVENISIDDELDLSDWNVDYGL